MLLVECLDQLGGGRDVIDNDVEEWVATSDLGRSEECWLAREQAYAEWQGGNKCVWVPVADDWLTDRSIDSIKIWDVRMSGP